MRHRVAGRHLGRETSHRIALYRNLVTDLLRYERITTTEAKAKEIRPMAEKIITLGRRGDLHARRQATRFVYDPKVVKKVFDEIGPRMATRPGGYLRITGLEPRKGDGARMSVIELVDFVDTPPTPRPARVTAAPAVASAAAAPVAAAPAALEAEEAQDTLAADEAAVIEAEEAIEEPAAEASVAQPEDEGAAEAPADAEITTAEGDEQAPA
jgi:large subunit ribosomal protein L17